MPDPILLLVDDDPETLASLASALERRFGADYRVLTERSPTSALARLEQACECGEDVALVVAHLWAPEMTGLDLLARVHDLCPRASRCVLVSYGDGPAYQHVRRAFVLGQLDTYLLKPWGDPEERLYPVVSEILGSWARSVRPGGNQLDDPQLPRIPQRHQRRRAGRASPRAGDFARRRVPVDP